jgi:hypothetical protein
VSGSIRKKLDAIGRRLPPPPPQVVTLSPAALALLPLAVKKALLAAVRLRQAETGQDNLPAGERPLIPLGELTLPPDVLAAVSDAYQKATTKGSRA